VLAADWTVICGAGLEKALQMRSDGAGLRMLAAVPGPAQPDQDAQN